MNLAIYKLLFIFFLMINDTFCADKDLYKVLGLPRSTSQNEIKKKYRDLSRKYHPDRNRGNPNATDKFAEVAEAYEILSDPAKRRKYDRGGMDAVNNEQQAANFDPFDIFGMFGGGGRQQGEKRDADLRIKIRVSLKDLYLGREFEYTFTRNTICPHCRGSGADSSDDVAVCNRCNGQGIVIERQQIAPGFVQQFQIQCPKCQGKGKMVNKHCHVCDGKKIVKGMEELTVYIEKGMTNGSEIKFEEYGEERIDMAPGHLVFVVQEIPNSSFIRQGKDLHTSVAITLKEALLGFTKQIKHLDDRIITVSKSVVTQPGDVIKVRGEGMPVHQSSERGDLFVKIDIVFPHSLTEKQLELAKLFFEKRTNW